MNEVYNLDIVKKFKFDLEMGRFNPSKNGDQNLVIFRTDKPYEIVFFIELLESCMNYKNSTFIEIPHPEGIAIDRLNNDFMVVDGLSFFTLEDKNEIPEYFKPAIEYMLSRYDIEYSDCGYTVEKKEPLRVDGSILYYY